MVMATLFVLACHRSAAGTSDLVLEPLIWFWEPQIWPWKTPGMEKSDMDWKPLIFSLPSNHKKNEREREGDTAADPRDAEIGRAHV